MAIQQPILTTSYGRLYKADCRDIIPSIPDGSIDCIFADPPFNLGKDYGSDTNDSLTHIEYLDWCDSWLKGCISLLSPGGAIFLFNLPKWNIELGARLNQLGMEFRHWIAIDLKMSLPIGGKLYPSHYSLLYYTRGKPRVFHRTRIPVAICRHCGGEIKDYGGHRNKLHENGITITDVWTDIAPVRHPSSKHRQGNELSEKLIRRVIEISTNAGDTIFDPFGGSGTTFAVAEEMHRNWIGCEIGDTDPIVARMNGTAFAIVAPNRGDSGRKVR